MIKAILVAGIFMSGVVAVTLKQQFKKHVQSSSLTISGKTTERLDVVYATSPGRIPVSTWANSSNPAQPCKRYLISFVLLRGLLLIKRVIYFSPTSPMIKYGSTIRKGNYLYSWTNPVAPMVCILTRKET